MTQASVLIVDDDELDRYLLTRDLGRSGIDAKIFECSDGQDALQFLETFDQHKQEHGEAFPPRIIFLDINMPRVTGLQFLEEFTKLRAQQPAYSTCVVMVFSSSEHPGERAQALSHEFVADFVVKGRTTSGELRDKVRQFLPA